MVTPARRSATAPEFSAQDFATHREKTARESINRYVLVMATLTATRASWKTPTRSWLMRESAWGDNQKKGVRFIFFEKNKPDTFFVRQLLIITRYHP
jgi:hypothetical protein